MAGFRLTTNSTVRSILVVRATAALVAMTTYVMTARAADPPPQVDGLDEIVVTARYTSESLQRAPITIAVVSAERLQEQGITNLTDVAQMTSSVEFTNPGSTFGKAMGAFIRGVGQSDFIPALQPGVGIYIDDVYYGQLTGSSFELGDTDRVEILKGPQGTLFGRNNEGGAVRIFNKTPVGDDSGYLEVGAGDYTQRLTKGAFDVRVLDNLFLRVAASNRSQAGYLDQIDFACAHPALAGNIKPIAVNGDCLSGKEGSENVTYVRAAIRWLPTDGLEINFATDYTTDNGSVFPDRTVYLSPGGFLLAANTNLNIPHYGIPVDNRFLTGFYSTYATNATFYNPLTGVYNNPVDNVSGGGESLAVDWDVTSDIHLKSITAFRNSNSENSFKQGGSPIWVAGDYTLFHHDQFSEELRLSGTLLDKALEWTTGAYFYHGAERTQGPVDISTVFPAFVFSQNNPSASDSKSAFLHAIYHATDKLSVEAGARYTKDNLSYTFAEQLFLLGVPLVPLTRTHTGDSHTDPKLAINYQWNPDFMTYVSWSKGFRSGGFNPRPSAADQVTSFAPEELTQYEIGEKSEWWDHRLQFNTALYWSEYTNLQQTINTAVDGVPALLYSNVGSARIKGVELELRLRPTSQWSFEASLGELGYRTLSLGEAAGIPGGPTLDTIPQGVPRFKGSVSGQYTFPFLSGNVSLRVDESYQSTTFWDAANTAVASQPGYAIMNAEVSWASPDKRWQTMLQITNALGKQYYYSLNNNIADWGTVEGQVAKPREMLFSIRRNFPGK